MKIIIEGTPEELKALFNDLEISSVDTDDNEEEEITGITDSQKTSGTESIKGTEDDEEIGETLKKIATAMLLFPRLRRLITDTGETK